MKGFKKILTAGVLTACVGFVSQQALAATDGTLGTTSTGTANLSLSITQLFKISGFTDFAFGAYTGNAGLTGNSDLCVYTNGSTGAYHIKVLDTSASPGFSVDDGAGHDIAYAVKWNNSAGTSGNVDVSYNTPLANTGANTASASCAGNKNANLQVNIADASIQAAPAGSYSTTLSVVLEP